MKTTDEKKEQEPFIFQMPELNEQQIQDLKTFNYESCGQMMLVKEPNISDQILQHNYISQRIAELEDLQDKFPENTRFEEWDVKTHALRTMKRQLQETIDNFLLYGNY